MQSGLPPSGALGQNPLGMVTPAPSTASPDTPPDAVKTGPRVRDSTHVLDGLLYHESDLRIEEHYTDTAGFTDHVFALMHLLGFRFAPRIRDLDDTKLYIPRGEAYEALKPMIGGTLASKWSLMVVVLGDELILGHAWPF